MMHFQIFQDLKDGERLHKPLLVRILVLSVISIIILLVAVYHVLIGDLNIWITLGIASVAFLLGLLVFSKMSKVQWDEEKEIISAGRMDMLSFGILALYIACEVGLRAILKIEYAGTFAATGYALVGIGASLLGRSAGSLAAIRKLVQ